MGILEPREIDDQELVWHCPTCTTYPREEDVEQVTVCGDCGETIQQLTSGDESWDFCEPCQQIEMKVEYVDECCECGTRLDEPTLEEAPELEPIID